MAKLLPFARKTCRWDTHLGIQRGMLYVEHILGTKTTSRYKEFSTKNENDNSSFTNDSKSVTVKQSGGEIQTTFTKVKETTKTASYMGVIVAGLGITAILFYTVLKELFSSKSPNNVYSKALERCRNDPNVQNALGVPIKGFGEETRRGRRRHVSHVVYNKDGVEHLRMKFYIEGLRKKATVFLEMREDLFGNYIYRYLFVDTDDFGRQPIILEDNRFSGIGDISKKKLGEDTDFIKELQADNDYGEYLYRYLFVETDDFGRPAIVLEDNRFGHVDPPKGRQIGEDEAFSKELETDIV